MPSLHTKEMLSDVLRTLLEWNIDRKLFTVTVDNCSTNDAVINIILDKLQRSTLVMRGSMLHMLSATHVLNLMAFVNGCCSAPVTIDFLLIKYFCFSRVEKNSLKQQLKCQWSIKNRTFYNMTKIPF